MYKQINYGQDARKAVSDGIEKVANAVKVTMGPKGKNVMIDKGYGAPIVTNDGITVAQNVALMDKMENLGANIVIEASGNTNDEAGDGTSTTAILVDEIVQEGLSYINTKVNPFTLGEGLRKAKDLIIAELLKNAKKIENSEDIKNIATISAQSEIVGKQISDAIDQVGEYGLVTVEKSSKDGEPTEFVKGMRIDQGLISPALVTNFARKNTEISKPLVILSDKKISDGKALVGIIDRLLSNNPRPLLIIAEDIDGTALASLVMNQLNKKISVIALKTPGYGDNKDEFLKDIATYTGAKIISEKTGITLENFGLEHTGSCDKVKSNQKETSIISGNGEGQEITNRIASLKQQQSDETSQFNKDLLKKRIAGLDSGVAILKVYGATDMELQNKKYKIEDAINATYAAIEKGIIPGGGTALLKAQKVLKDMECSNKEEKLGVDILTAAIESPAWQIASNAGHKGHGVVSRTVESDDFNYGFDSKDGTYKDLIKAGVIDPVKVTIVALENAVSAAIMVLTTDAVIIDDPDEENEKQIAPQMM